MEETIGTPSNWFFEKGEGGSTFLPQNGGNINKRGEGGGTNLHLPELDRKKKTKGNTGSD